MPSAELTGNSTDHHSHSDLIIVDFLRVHSQEDSPVCIVYTLLPLQLRPSHSLSMPVHVLEHPLAKVQLSIFRDRNTGAADFR